MEDRYKPLVQRLVDAYVLFNCANPNWDSWRHMNTEQLAGYFIIFKGIQVGSDAIIYANESAPECPGWGGFSGSTEQNDVMDLFDRAVDEFHNP